MYLCTYIRTYTVSPGSGLDVEMRHLPPNSTSPANSRVRVDETIGFGEGGHPQAEM
jgi:hypothetical protein